VDIKVTKATERREESCRQLDVANERLCTIEKGETQLVKFSFPSGSEPSPVVEESRDLIVEGEGA
jgi:hypothetical protein